jgi:hypothetical protein
MKRTVPIMVEGKLVGTAEIEDGPNGILVSMTNITDKDTIAFLKGNLTDFSIQKTPPRIHFRYDNVQLGEN